MNPAVLVYHGIAEPGGGDPARLLTAPRHLEAHIRFLQRRGYRFLTAEELLDEGGPAMDGLPCSPSTTVSATG